MLKKVLAVAGVATAMAVFGTVHAIGRPAAAEAFTLAVYGDAPYGTKPTDTSEFDATPAFIDSINADPEVSGVIHVGDIHSGGSYNASTGQIDNVRDPSTGQPVDYARGNPVASLGLVRSIFFAQPGQTLGSGTLDVTSQATDHDPRLRWLRAGFAAAESVDAAGVVVITQADMWDLDRKTTDHLTNYEPIIDVLASRTAAFGKPVLLFTGDSHVYRSDNPLAPGAPCTGDAGVCSYDAWQSHPYYDVPNFHRVVVHGSTFPLEWLKLTVDPAANAPASDTTFGPFSWQRMPQP